MERAAQRAQHQALAEDGNGRARRHGGRVVAGLAVVGLLSGAVLTASVGAEARHGSGRGNRSVAFTTTTSATTLLGSPLCLDPNVTTESCLRATGIGSVVLEGDISGSGVGTTVGMTAGENIRRTQGMLRLTVTDSPCGAGSITLETFTTLRIVAPTTPPETISASWDLVPEQGGGALAGARGKGTITNLTVRPDGAFVSELEGKIRCR